MVKRTLATRHLLFARSYSILLGVGGIEFGHVAERFGNVRLLDEDPQKGTEGRERGGDEVHSGLGAGPGHGFDDVKGWVGEEIDGEEGDEAKD